MRTSWSSGRGDDVNVSPLCPLCSHQPCAGVPKGDALFRKITYFDCWIPNIAPYVTFIGTRSHWCLLSTRPCRSCSAELLSCSCTSSPYCCSGLSSSCTGLCSCLCWLSWGPCQATPGFWSLCPAALPSSIHNCFFHKFSEDAVHPCLGLFSRFKGDWPRIDGWGSHHS